MLNQAEVLRSPETFIHGILEELEDYDFFVTLRSSELPRACGWNRCSRNRIAELERKFADNGLRTAEPIPTSGDALIIFFKVGGAVDRLRERSSAADVQGVG